MPRSCEDIHRPFARALLAGGVENLVHQRLAVGVLVSENVAGDFDEIGIQFALVPFGKNFVHLVRASGPGRFSSGCRLRKSTACRRIRCRCGPSSRNGPRRLRPPSRSTARRLHLRGDGLENRSFTCGHAAGEPPGMMLGPRRAPSSPPLTPVPM